MYLTAKLRINSSLASNLQECRSIILLIDLYYMGQLEQTGHEELLGARIRVGSVPGLGCSDCRPITRNSRGNNSILKLLEHYQLLQQQCKTKQMHYVIYATI